MFQVGDRVILIVDNPDNNACLNAGDTGVVMSISDGPTDQRVGVKWDDFHDGHSLNGRCDYGEGWFVWPHEVMSFEEDDTEIDLSDLL